MVILLYSNTLGTESNRRISSRAGSKVSSSSTNSRAQNNNRPTTDYEFNIYPNETVKQLKIRLQSIINLPWNMQRIVYAGQQYQNHILCSVVLSRGKYATQNNGGSSKRSSNDMLNVANNNNNNRAERVSLYVVRCTPVPGQKQGHDHIDDHESL